MFLDHQDIRKEIQDRIAATKTFDGAIAFWGKGADTRLLESVSGDQIRIICNLFSGGTNPKVIRALLKKGAKVKRRDDLHAKVYVFTDSAIVGSANFSANGLGLEGKEQTGWIEAGVVLEGSASDAARSWFETQWRNPLAAAITEPDLKAAELIWKRRKTQLLQLPEISDFDFDCSFSELPLVAWLGGEDWNFSPSTKKRLKSMTKAEQDQLWWQIDNGLEIEAKGDEKLLTPGRWVMCWNRNNKGNVDKREGLSWICLDQVLPESFVGEDKGGLPRHAVLAAVRPGPGPFDLNDKKLLQAVSEVLDQYDEFKTDSYKGAWYWDRRMLFRPFWQKVKKRYRALKKQ